MDFQKVSFKNKELDLNLAGILYTPDDLDVSKSYPAVVVTGPMLSIKEQAQSVYAKRLAEIGYVTLVFDGSSRGPRTSWPPFPMSTRAASAASASADPALTCPWRE